MSKIFISYRRDDSRWPAQQLARRIRALAPDSEIFMDVDSIPVGVDFVEVLGTEVQQCDVLLALIGTGWLNASADEGATRRLDDPHDFIRIEIGAALARDIPVVPVLIDDATIPPAEALPDDLKALSRRNAEIVHQRTFEHDVERLLKKLGVEVKAPSEGPSGATILSGLLDRARSREGRIALGALAALAVMAVVLPGLLSGKPELTDGGKVTPAPPPAQAIVIGAPLPEPEITDEATRALVRHCDELAGHHLDRTLPLGIKGKTISQIREDPLPALAACKAAVEAVPDSARMNLNYSRALFAKKEVRQGLNYVTRAAELGSLRGQMALGLRNVDGEGLTEQNFDVARAYFEATSKQGEPTARAVLGRLAAVGIGEPADLEKAFTIAVEAAEEGYNRSQYNVGVMLANGIGTAPDAERAFIYFNTSVQNEAITPLAYTELGWMWEKGIGAPRADSKRALEYYQKGRFYGHRLASLALARHNLVGDGMPQNIDAGILFLEEALSREFYSVKDDALWTYEPNPHFEALAREAIADIGPVVEASGNAHLSRLYETLKQDFRQRKIPMQEEILCTNPEDAKTVLWCVQYWADKPPREL
ncbi:MAG: toll/interleukin-1 receptor domain-containing protein [Hyphomonas sp.]